MRDGLSACFARTGASPLSPLVKSLVADAEPAAIALRGRASIMHRIESRFRFLAVSTRPTPHPDRSFAELCRSMAMMHFALI